MKYFSACTIKFFMFILPFMPSSYAADGKWSDGFGQGDYEYSIEVKKYRLYISCPTENGNASASSFVEFSDSGNELKSFEISVNGKKYQGPFEASSRVGANNFTALLDDLKKSDAVVSFKNGSVTLPKSNASSVLPSYGKKGFACNLDDVQTANKPNPIERPSNPSVYGECHGALSAQLKLTGGKLSSQKAVDFHKTWTPFAETLKADVKKGGGCTGNLSDSQLLACYNKILPNKSDAQFMFKANIGYEAVIEKPASSANLTIAKICGSLVMETTPVSSSSNSQSTASSSSSQPSSGTITRIDTSTGNVAISSFSRVTVGKGTSITVNGNRVKNEGDLMVGDRCTVRMESYDLYAQNSICTR